ncbi:hypothetical protein MCHI_003704 [Candidatus Magnetoovum chiemensis]|nr:hypothetical protein MCHI_003704 [Candidatus Magnetoovum chiemensis]
MEYLRKGEDAVKNFESLISLSADRVYGELLSLPDQNKGLLNVLSDKQTAVVVYDGLSLRELPIILQLAEKSGLTASEIDCSLASAPCDTLEYIKREFNLSKVAPSTLPSRKELKEKNITASYTANPTQSAGNGELGKSFLIWSAFPDNTYRDSGAKFENHFENIHVQIETAWINTVQQIKGKSKIIITSDHGYIFFGTGMEFPRTLSEMRELNNYFGNDRFAYLSDKPNVPLSDDVYVDESRQVAMLKGRVKTRSTGEASSKLYKHGGLSLMEMLTPWIILEQ